MNKVILAFSISFCISAFCVAQTTSNGSYLVTGNEKGYLFDTQTEPTWGYWYGLYRGKVGNKSLSGTNDNFATPVILQSFYGIGLRTYQGQVTIGKNGATTVGIFSDAELTSIHNVAVPTYKLYVGGGIRTEEVKVDLKAAWPDYVFDPNYKLPSLKETEAFIQANKHLPNMPSAATLKAEGGLELGVMVTKQQEKIEELYLLMIEMEKKMEALAAENQLLKSQNTTSKKK